MNGKRAKRIFNLVRDKDENLLNSIKEKVGEKRFETMGGLEIYKMSKRMWTQIKSKNNWGKKGN